MRAGAEVIYQACFVDGDWRGFADFVERQADGRYEVVDTKLARHSKPAYVLQLCFYSEQVGRIQGSMPERMHVVLGNRERETPPRRRLPRLLPPGARAVRARGRGGDRRLPAAGLVLRPLRLPRSGARRGGGRTTTSASSRGCGATRCGGSRPRGSRPLPSSRAPPTRRGRRRCRRARSRRCATRRRCRSRRARTATPGRCSPPEPARGFELLPPPSDGDLFFDIEGDPFWEPGARARVPLGDRRHRRRVHAVLGARPRAGAARGRGRHRPDPRAPRRATRRCTSTTTPPTRSPRSSGSPASTARARRSSTTCSAARSSSTSTRSSRRGSGSRTSATGSSRSRRSTSSATPTCAPATTRSCSTRSGSSGTTPRSSTRSPPTTRRTASRRCGCATGCCSIRPGRGAAARGARAARAARGRGRDRGAPRRAPRRAARRPPRRRAADRPRWLLAQLLLYHRREEKPVWWAFFDRIGRTTEELQERDSDAIGGLEPAGPPIGSGQSLVWPFTLPRAAAPPRPGRQRLRPGDRRLRGHDRGARRGGGDAPPPPRPDARGRPAADGAHPGRALSRRRAAGGAPAPRRARCSPATSATRAAEVDPRPRAVPGCRSRRTTSTRRRISSPGSTAGTS